MRARNPLAGGVAAGMLAFIGCSSSTPAETAPPIVCAPATEDAPAELACTGLYSDFQTRTVSATARPYAPAVAFWSDGYDKERWIELPEGKSIDASSMDDWKFPVGTKVWKEFRFDQRKIETRLLWKVKEDRWVKAAYVWSEDGKTATRRDGASLTVAGADYQVPSVTECNQCHKGKQDTLLGFEALSLAQSAATGVTLAALVQENRIAPAPAKTALAIDPGLGVLHVNCGVSCHNGSPVAEGRQSTLRLRVGFDEAANQPVSAWQLFGSTVGVAATLPGWSGSQRIAPGKPETSAIVMAMKARGTGQMPPNTTTVDATGVAAVEAFVRSLPP